LKLKLKLKLVQQLRRTNSAPVGSPAGKKPSSMFGWLNPKNWAAWGRSRRVKRHHDSDSSEDSSDSSDYSYDTDYSSENGEKSRGGRRTTRGGRDWDRDHGNYVERSRRHEREYDRARKFDRFLYTKIYKIKKF
jgi:hypothetical protein